MQVVTFLGWRIGGWPAAIVATIMFLLPAFAIMTVAAAAVFALPDLPVVRGALAGLQVAVVGLLGAAMWRLSAQRGRFRRRCSLCSLTAALAGFFVNAALIVLLAGLVGIGFDRMRRHA